MVISVTVVVDAAEITVDVIEMEGSSTVIGLLNDDGNSVDIVEVVATVVVASGVVSVVADVLVSVIVVAVVVLVSVVAVDDVDVTVVGVDVVMVDDVLVSVVDVVVKSMVEIYATKRDKSFVSSCCMSNYATKNNARSVSLTQQRETSLSSARIFCEITRQKNNAGSVSFRSMRSCIKEKN
jgi:hypothetical protein